MGLTNNLGKISNTITATPSLVTITTSQITNASPIANDFAVKFIGNTTSGQSFGLQVWGGTNSSDTSFRVLNASAGSEYFKIRGDGASYFSGLVNLNSSSNAFQVNGYQFGKYSYFGYSSGYPGVLVGSTGSQSLFFNVDPVANTSGSFSGNGSEYMWRNAGSFITPNATNNGYNTLIGWNTSGQVGINRSAPEFALDVNGDIAFNRTNKLMFAGPVAGDRARSYLTGDSSNNIFIYGPYGNAVMSFGASGNIGIGTTTPSYQVEMITSANNSLLYVSQSNGAVGGNAAIIVNIETTGGYLMLFRYGQASKGSITTNGSAVAYNTTISDVRLKKNFEDWNENVLDLFKEIKPTLFNYLDDEDGKKKTKGYIAQQEVDKFPEAYTIDHEGYHSFNPSGMMEYAMKALKEAALRIEQLEAKVTALENR